MKYLKMKSRQVFVETMVEPIIEILQQGPIELIVGQFNEEKHSPLRAVIIVAGISVDNEEAFKCQGLSFGSRCHSNCRLCTMPSQEFYTFSTLSQIYQDPLSSQMDTINILDAYNDINKELYPIRNSISNMKTAIATELIWWKQVLFNKNKQQRGQKLLKLSGSERQLLSNAKLLNIKPIGNNIMSEVLYPFYTRFGKMEKSPLIHLDLCFPPDKLHSFDKGVVEYTLKNIVSLFILYQKQQPRLYGNNMSIIDERILTFDIFQPVSYWGDIPQRRIPGLSGKYIYFN